MTDADPIDAAIYDQVGKPIADWLQARGCTVPDVRELGRIALEAAKRRTIPYGDAMDLMRATRELATQPDLETLNRVEREFINPPLQASKDTP